jgi:hypothetical protein
MVDLCLLHVIGCLLFPLTLMLDFKLLIINDVALWKSLLDSVLDFKSLAINDVALVVLYMRICVYDFMARASRRNTHLPILFSATTYSPHRKQRRTSPAHLFSWWNGIPAS